MDAIDPYPRKTKENACTCSAASTRSQNRTGGKGHRSITLAEGKRDRCRCVDLLCWLLCLLVWTPAETAVGRAQTLPISSPAASSTQEQPSDSDGWLESWSRPQTQTPPAPAQAQTNGSGPDLKSEEKQRFLGIVPTRNVVINGQSTPLRSAQKFDLYLHSTIDPFTFFAAGVVGGVEQAENSYPAFGQGAAGFGKRFGTAYADSVDSHLWGKAILPSIFHQDPRYFRRGTGPGSKRLLYGIAAVVRCKGDDGHWQFAYSNISGNFIAGAISNVYFPSQDRGARLVLNRGLVVTAEGAVGYVFSEFYPDLAAKLHHSHAQANPASIP